MVRALLFRLRRLWNWRDHEAAMDAEMRQHIEMETAAHVAAGVSPDEAARIARLDFGGVDRHKEAARDQRSVAVVEEFVRDAMHALRVLRRNPGYSVATALTLALGVGCLTSIYSVVHGVLLRPLPYAHPQQLTVVRERNPSRNVEANVVSVAMFEDVRDQNHSFASVAAVVPQPVTLGGADPERVMGADVSGTYFGLLGVTAAIGRVFSQADLAAGDNNVIVLSDGFWRRRFAADPGVVGRTVLLDERPFTVIGVMPSAFDPPTLGWLSDQQFWTPWAATADNRSWGRFLIVLARLRPGIRIDDARKELVAIADRRARADPELASWSASIVPLTTQITGDVRRPLFLLLTAVGLLLVLAATNVGGLILGFMRRRAHEHLLRRAIGASAARLFRELVTHVFVLGAIGVAAGLMLAAIGTRALVALLPPEVPRISSVTLDTPVLVAGGALGLAAALACAIVAALRANAEPANASRTVGTRITARAGRGWLVIVEIALSVVLTVLAGLMGRSFANLRAVRLGFDANGVVTGRIALPDANYGSIDRQRQLYDAFGARLRAIPGVTSVAFVTSRPFACCAPSTAATNPREPTLDAGTVRIRYTDSAYFATLRIARLAGSTFASREPADGLPHVIINQRLAAALYHGDAVGKPIRIDLGDPVTKQPVNGQIVGVVGDVHLTDVRTGPAATAYLATARFPQSVRDVVIRTDANADGTIAAARRALHELDPTLPFSMAMSLSASVALSLARDRFITLILGAFAMVSLLLAAVGVYGMFAADVATRQKEIGVRVALGASPGVVIGLLLRRALSLAAAGAAIGALAGLLVSRFTSAILFDVPTSDPLSYVAVSLLLVSVALVATLIPAVRAANISPLEAIRLE